MIHFNRQIQSRQAAQAMPPISEKKHDEDEKMSDDEDDAEMDDFLEEAMEDDDSFNTNGEGPTPPKNARRSAVSIRTGCSPTASAASWEFETPSRRDQQHKVSFILKFTLSNFCMVCI